jgi:hypothetical protein
VLKPNFPLAMAHVKSSYEKSTKALVDELQGKFPNHELMSTLGVIYPNFWVANLDNVGDVFHQCLIFVKVAYRSPHKVGKDGVWMKALLDGYLLDSQCFFFKVIANIESIVKEVYNVNPMIQLWAKISSSTIFKLKLL